MRRAWIGAGAAAWLFLAAGIAPQTGISASARQSKSAAALSAESRASRISPADLEISGDLAGFPPGSTRYLTRNDLLALPQVTYRIANDANFGGSVRLSGVALEELARRYGAAPNTEMVIAVCDDKYRAHYSRAYLAAHQPFLVLEVNGQPPADWPKSSGGDDMGPYLISHPEFKPGSPILSQAEEPQIPWGVVRLEFRDESTVFGSIAPGGATAKDADVLAGFRLAQQNCFRCHNMGSEGGQKAGVPWTVLAGFAEKAPAFFAAYVRNPQATNPRAKMEGSPQYDDAAIGALEAYFRTFAAQGKP